MKLAGDKIFAIIVLVLVVGGIALFSSAALGLLARVDGSPWKLVVSQIGLGLIPGLILLAIFRFMPQKRLAQFIMPFYVITVILTILVFVPHIGLTINGARRWLDLRFTTFQPGEFLKLSVILMLAAYLSQAKGKIAEWKTGLLPFVVIVGIPSALLITEPNTSTTLIIGLSCAVMYFLAGAPLRDFGIMVVGTILLLTALVFARPYLMSRVVTFIHPQSNAQTSGYHIQQSLIAIGSGGISGRGFGQSVQKFNYLPEAESDSVFAVYGEEFGFIGTVLLVILFIAFALRGLIIAGESSSLFGSLAVTGLTLVITFSAFMNIGA
ncbi:MAG: Cell division protein FtsW, partial [Parcubacteria group bacterium]|nr:Cell division protein FtsW [Parcubacteria group bacterium]